MRKFLLTAALIALTPASLAGGGNSVRPPNPPQPFGTPANTLVKPGQTWIMTGTTADGEAVNTEFKLSNKAPTISDGDWDFDTPNGPLTYNPAYKTLFARNVSPAALQGESVQICIAMTEGKQASGALLSGTMEEIGAQMKKLPSDAADPQNAADIQSMLKSFGISAGSCTLKIK